MQNAPAARPDRTIRIVHQTLPYNFVRGAELEQNYPVTVKSQGNLAIPGLLNPPRPQHGRKP